MKGIIKEVENEMDSQNKKWGSNRTHHPAEWLMILGEEVGEANQAALEAHFSGYEGTGDWSNYRAELIQVAAVAIQMIHSHDIQKAGYHKGKKKDEGKQN